MGLCNARIQQAPHTARQARKCTATKEFFLILHNGQLDLVICRYVRERF